MTVQRGKKLTISIQEHMAIDVCPGPIRPIRQISAYFPRLSPTSPTPLSPNPSLSPPVASAMGGAHLLSPLRAHRGWGGGSLSQNSSMDTSVEINSDDSDDCTALGTLEFELRYEQSSSELHCTLLKAKVKPPVLPQFSFDSHELLNVVMNAVTTPLLDHLNSEENQKLTHNELIGESRVPLKRLKPNVTKHFYTCLEHPPPLPSPSAVGEALRGISCYLREWENEQLHSLEERGRLLLSLQFLPPVSPEDPDGDGRGRSEGRRNGGLCVAVKRCAHLAAMDVNGFSDPYVKIYLKPDIKKKSKHKTAVMKKTLNPEYNEEFFYEISLTELAKKSLEVTVWDYDLGRSNDFIGGVCLSCRSKGDALRHWMDCLKNKGCRVERWHILTNELPRSFSHD
uniref:Double C2-like domains, alpha n=1 Tax=Oryzias melastigma TaxID=30732 RepID=A0A3B3CKS1_ORYME